MLCKADKLPYEAVRPYSTRESESSLVCQPMLAWLAVIAEALTAVITGAVLSTVTLLVAWLVLPLESVALAVMVWAASARPSVFSV